MTKSTQVRLVAEAGLIVVSILLAFSIDAWWDDLGRGRDEREAYRALVQDFEAAATHLEEVRQVHDRVLGASAALLDLTGPSAEAPPRDSLDVLLGSLGRIANFAPPLGALQSMLGSGELRLVKSTELRASLASFPSQLAEMNRTQGYGAEQVFGQLLPFLDRSIPRETDTRFVRDPQSLLRSFEFENLVRGRRVNQERALDAAERMATLIDDILRALHVELSAA